MGSFLTGLSQNIQEGTKALVFVLVFLFVLVDEQAIGGLALKAPSILKFNFVSCHLGLLKDVA